MTNLTSSPSAVPSTPDMKDAIEAKMALLREKIAKMRTKAAVTAYQEKKIENPGKEIATYNL